MRIARNNAALSERDEICQEKNICQISYDAVTEEIFFFGLTHLVIFLGPEPGIQFCVERGDLFD